MNRIDRSAFLGGLAGTLVGLWVVGAARVAAERHGSRQARLRRAGARYRQARADIDHLQGDRPIPGERVVGAWGGTWRDLS